MIGIYYDLAAGLDLLVPDAEYEGSLSNNTEEEYNNIVWLDERTKPTYAEADEAALNAMRNDLAIKINEKTRDRIINGFTTSLSPDTPIEATIEWQFNTLNLWLNRDSSNITYPYQLYCSLAVTAESNYISIENADDFNTLYWEMFSHVDQWLTSGREEKSKLSTMTREELEAYEDPR